MKENVSVYHCGLSVTGRKITEKSPQRIGTLKTLPQGTERSYRAKMERGLVNFQEVVEPGEGIV